MDVVLLGNQFSLREYFNNNEQAAHVWFKLSNEEKTLEKLIELFGENFTKLMEYINRIDKNKNGPCYGCGIHFNLVSPGFRCNSCVYSFCDEHSVEHICDSTKPIKYKMLYPIFRLYAEVDENKQTGDLLSIKQSGDYVFNEQLIVDQKSHFTFSHDSVEYLIKHIKPEYDNVTFLLKNVMKVYNLTTVKQIAIKNFKSPNSELSGDQMFISTFVNKQYNKYSSTWFKLCMIEALTKIPIDKIDFEFDD